MSANFSALGARREQAALDKLTPIVYNELHRLARHYMTRERAGHSLQTTAAGE